MIRQRVELAKEEYFTFSLYWAYSLRFLPGEGLLVGLNHRICMFICRVYGCKGCHGTHHLAGYRFAYIINRRE